MPPLLPTRSYAYVRRCKPFGHQGKSMTQIIHFIGCSHSPPGLCIQTWRTGWQCCTQHCGSNQRCIKFVKQNWVYGYLVAFHWYNCISGCWFTFKVLILQGLKDSGCILFPQVILLLGFKTPPSVFIDKRRRASFILPSSILLANSISGLSESKMVERKAFLFRFLWRVLPSVIRVSKSSFFHSFMLHSRQSLCSLCFDLACGFCRSSDGKIAIAFRAMHLG